MRKFLITAPARQDIKEALLKSIDRHGRITQRSYANLITVALKHLESIEEPYHPYGSSEHDDTYRMYHLNMAKRDSAKMGFQIKQPSHAFFYEVTDNEIIVHALIPDMRDFPRHLS